MNPVEVAAFSLGYYSTLGLIAAAVIVLPTAGYLLITEIRRTR